jgi:hypothetical protein
MKTTTCAVMASAALALVGCAEDFDTSDMLKHLRILAIQAEPPQPATGQSTTLRALVYQPPASGVADREEAVTGYHWSWCPTATSPEDLSKCPVDQNMADMLFAGIPGVPPLDLGTNETATFTNPFPSSLLAALCQKDYSVLPALNQALSDQGGLANNAASIFRCEIGGFPITIQLVMDAMVAGKPKQFPAIFKIFLPTNDAVPPNHNPVVGAISLREAGIDYPVDEAATWSVVRDGEAIVHLDVPLSSSEPLPNWQDVHMLKDPHHQPNEQLTVFWFTEGGIFNGKLGEETTMYYGGDPNDPVSPFSSLLENKFEAFKADKYQGATARFYMVVRDLRNGVSWTTGVVRLVDSPESRDGGMPDRPADAEAPPDATPPDSEVDAGVVDGVDAGVADAGVVDAMGEVLP